VAESTTQDVRIRDLVDRALVAQRSLADGGTLYEAADKLGFIGTRIIELSATPKRAARTATLGLRFGTVRLKRPPRPGLKDLPDAVQLTLVEAVELDPPDSVEPVHWRLLTTHAADNDRAAWQIVDWYRLRWTIEQLFRVLKSQGLRIEDSQLDSAEVLLKLIAMATKAATITLQLLQARDGRSDLPAAAAFDGVQIDALAAINARYQAKSPRQKNPHPFASMAWAGWVIARHALLLEELLVREAAAGRIAAPIGFGGLLAQA